MGASFDKVGGVKRKKIVHTSFCCGVGAGTWAVVIRLARSSDLASDDTRSLVHVHKFVNHTFCND